MDIRLVPCEACGTEGRKLIGPANDPNPRDDGPCLACDGTGSEIVEVEPVDMNERCAHCGRDLVLRSFHPCLEQGCPFASCVKVDGEWLMCTEAQLARIHNDEDWEFSNRHETGRYREFNDEW